MQSGAQIIAISHVIQQAVAPVFLLTGVGALLGVLTNRLSRIIDRLRSLSAERSAAHEASEENTPEYREAQRNLLGEMALLSRRRASIHWAIILCTLCALLVCVVIATMFLGVEFGADPSRLVGLLFVTAMGSLIAGLLCFLHEIALATTTFERRYGSAGNAESVR
ncbi:MAG TPA: DUF2721 domain-containing protein [Burkholderiaceae bacterium]|nr:DUF2721 domain-containing protein [Burkholderiaceae bacterium]